MPLRHAVSPLTPSVSAARPRRCLLYGIAPFLLSPATSPSNGFHSSTHLRDKQIDSSKNHYETLKLQPGATPAEIKKSFYSLSKTHHPDHNPSNPHASRRFMRISEAYSILSIPAKRATYDRDTLQLHKRAQHQHQQQQQRHPSYSSTNPAGGRPASGLSRRRSAFQGPPPSFFRSGGWGAHGAKRKAAQDESAGSPSSTSTSSSQSSSPKTGTGHESTGTGAGGMGPGQTPFGRGYEGEVPHFDRVSHEHSSARWSDKRRTQQQRRTYFNEHEIDLNARPRSEERGEGAMFIVVGGILAMSIMIPLALSRIWDSGGGDKDKKGKKGKWSAPA
ncbi:DnaJ-domain-containing protein [Annulohypoxylon maeteangense]|uniref:DnaJ-domain-containing protein n=1 Tax=Annulohypoxylon maeteangense TaxID=1927788 RepID=UPI0020089E87|nr:DnaJ-domain-containing protein [Annulohypoxylon maeteangense]KAI0885726.1 DnaJ-domain-containing protein [Annulohypoxylon maeteangense]